jgi:hypothetical protein
LIRRFLSSFCSIRAFTSFFTRAAGRGLSTGKRMVHREGEVLEFVLEHLHQGRAHGKQLQWFENAANPTGSPLYLNRNFQNLKNMFLGN